MAYYMSFYRFANLSNDDYGSDNRENHIKTYVNDKGANQPAHPQSLISAFVVRCLDSNVILQLQAI